MRWPAASLAIVASLTAARPSFADWLVTHDGQRIETVGAWRVEGGQVVFESRSVPVRGWISPSGTQFMVSVDYIDLGRSVAETEAQAGVRRKDLARSLREAAAAPNTLLGGWDRWGEYLGEPPDRAELVVKIGGAGWDNFLQAPATRNREEVAASVGEGRLTWRMFGGAKSYVEAGHIQYDTVPSTTAYGAGVRIDGPRHGLQLGARLEPDRRAPDLNDDGDLSDVRWYRARYLGHGGSFNWWLSGERLEQEFQDIAPRQSTGHGLRAAIAHRAFDGRLAPELGFAWSTHDATGESEDERQRTLLLGVRARPLGPLALAIRYERMQRRFVIADPRARNFRREDDRARWILEGEIKITRQLALSLLYSHLQGTSTRPGRDFSAQNAAAGLTVTLGSTRRAGSAPPRPKTRRPARGVIQEPIALETVPPARPPLATTEAAAVALPTPPAVGITVPAQHGLRSDPGTVAEPPAPQRAALTPPPVRHATRLVDLHTRTAGGETTTTLQGDGELRYATLTLTAPDRLVVDLFGIFVGHPRTISVGADLLQRVRVAQFQPGPEPVGRIVFDLERPAAVDVECREGLLRVRLRDPR